MFFSLRSIFYVAVFSMSLFVLGCTEQLQSGSLKKDFGGVDQVEILSPTRVRLTWELHNRYKTYSVYSSSSSTPIETTGFNESIVSDLTPDTAYTFKVVATDGDNAVGGAKEITVTTPKRFSGIKGLQKDADGNVIVTWEYPQQVLDFQIFYKEYEDPTSENTTNWATPNATINTFQHTFRSLEGSTRYHFVVHAKYLDGTFERTTNALSIVTDSSFPNPTYSLSPISIGSLPYAEVNPVVNTEYLEKNYTSRIYMDETPITDPLVGRGVMTFSSNLKFPLGQLKDLTLKVTYNDGVINQTKVFEGLSTYIKGVATDQQKPPLQSFTEGLSFMGEALSTGDFNCDGAPDLAVGLPKASLASMGVRSENAGAVYIYYSAKDADDRYRLRTTPQPALNPVVPGRDPQVITFEDLTHQSKFGTSLSSGNLNGDINAGKPCQDLIVGASGLNTEDDGGYDGAAFVFFGSSKGLKAPNRIKDIQQNTETCNGLYDGATCSAVMLWPDMRLYPSALFKPENYTKYSDDYEEFGYTVSFIGDFNADGFDDLAVGAPGAAWDGPANFSTGVAAFADEVGYVAIYFGSKFGLGKENVKDDHFLRFIKVFSPYPHPYQRFGHSIAGGVDVDGKYKTKTSGASARYGGADFVIGAPGFNYPYWNGSNKFYQGFLASCWAGNNKNPDNCPVASGFHADEQGGWGAYNTGTSSYGYVQNGTASLGSAVGAAFLYFGIGSTTTDTIVSNTASRQNFYQCGRRGGMGDPTRGLTHFSCFAGKQTGFGDRMPYRILFPRSDYKNLKNYAFGSAVAMAGSASYYDENNTPISNAQRSDPNGDGYGEVIVASGNFTDGINNKTNMGALWTFYGNSERLYEYKPFFGLDSGGLSRTDADFIDGNPSCTGFVDVLDATKKACAPTLLRANSIAAQTKLGYYPESIAVADITGDGKKDVIVGGVGDANKGTMAGAVFAFTSLAGTGLTTNYFNYYNSNGNAYDYFGRSVAAGDFDGDITGGKVFNDLAVGAYMDKSTKLGGGAVYGFLSKGQPLSSMITIADFNLQDTLASIQNFGLERTRIVGDINGDGFDDAASRISRPSSSTEAYVTDAVIYAGSNIGLITTDFCLNNKDRIFKAGMGSDVNCYPSVTPAQGITMNDIVLPQLIARPNGLSQGWATLAMAAGDVNGDGFADVAFHDWNAGGQIVVYFGTRGGLQAINNPVWMPASGDPQIVTKMNAVMGGSVVDVLDDLNMEERQALVFGDFNGDFKTDIVILNPTASSFFSMNKAGSGTSGLLPPVGDTVAVNNGWQCGNFVAPDSPPAECANGSPAYEMGRVFIYYGSETGVQTPQTRGYTTSGELTVNFGNPATHSTYLVDAYGSDGVATQQACNASTKVCKVQYLYSPMVANVWFGFESMRHQFGAAASALDADGDGIDDLAIGAPGWEDLDCYYDNSSDIDPITAKPRTNYGRVFFYKGSVNGIVAKGRNDYYNSVYSSGACLTNDVGRVDDDALNVTGTHSHALALMPPLLGTTLPGRNSNNRGFGSRLASADFNNDGIEDLAVGAPVETPIGGLGLQGVGYVFYGPLCGADNSSGIWDYYGLGNYNKQKLYSSPGVDVVPGLDCGSKTLAPQAFFVKESRANDFFGTTLVTNKKEIYSSGTTASGFSDFNGDGFDDLIIGGYGWADEINGNEDHGLGIVLFGSTSGLFTDEYPSSSIIVSEITDTNSDNHVVIKPFAVPFLDVNEPSPSYYRSHTSTGDVNGDGTMDFMGTSRYHDGYAPLKGINIGTFFLFY